MCKFLRGYVCVCLFNTCTLTVVHVLVLEIYFSHNKNVSKQQNKRASERERERELCTILGVLFLCQTNQLKVDIIFSVMWESSPSAICACVGVSLVHCVP